MRVSAISQTNYVRTRNVKTQVLPKCNENVSFNGAKGAITGGLAGTAAAIGLGVLTGGAGLGLLPLWAWAGGSIGHYFEKQLDEEASQAKNTNEEKIEKEDKDDYEYSKYTDTSGFDPSYEESFTRF